MKKCITCGIEKEETLFRLRYGENCQPCKECHAKKYRTGKEHPAKFKKGQKALNPFPKGNIPWNKNKKMSEEYVEKCRHNRKRTKIHKRSGYFKEWAKKVKERDGHKCQNCGTDKILHSHHIIPWKVNEFKRFDVDNGITLCNRCHAKIEGYQKGHETPPEIRKKISKTKRGKKWSEPPPIV